MSEQNEVEAPETPLAPEPVVVPDDITEDWEPVDYQTPNEDDDEPVETACGAVEEEGDLDG